MLAMAKKTVQQVIAETVLPRLATTALSGTVKLVVGGQPYYLRLGDRPELLTTPPSKVEAIVRAEADDLRALLEGRMSWADGLLTERIGVGGDVAFLARLAELLGGKA